MKKLIFLLLFGLGYAAVRGIFLYRKNDGEIETGICLLFIRSYLGGIAYNLLLLPFDIGIEEGGRFYFRFSFQQDTM